MKYELELYLCVAALHDAFEDHPDKISIVDIRLKVQAFWIKHYGLVDSWTYGNKIAEAVDAISKKPIKGQEAYALYVIRVLKNEYARIVKLADLKHNMSDLGYGSMYDKYSLTTLVLTRGLK